MRIEVFWPTEGEHVGRAIGLRQLAFSRRLGEYPVKTLYVPLEQARELGVALVLAAQQAPRRPSQAREGAGPCRRGRAPGFTILPSKRTEDG
jgi:hypothetical protein